MNGETRYLGTLAIWGWPLVLGILTAVGLVAALFSDGMKAEEANRVGVDMSLDTEHLIRERADMPEGGDAPLRQ